MNRTRLVSLLAAVCVAYTAWAQERSFDVPASDAVHAIPEFARQAGLQIVAPADGLKGIDTPAIKGTLDSRAALKRLLVGTGLEIASDDGAVITLRKVSKKPATPESTTTAGPPTAAGLSDALLEEVIVTGSRIPLAAGQPSAQPVRIYTREAIERSGQNTVADFLSTRPEVSTSSIDSAIGSYADQTSVQLHGLPIGTTLILLNGRRVEINNYGFFDLNYIPLEALERIEVLPVGSSAVYGADSLAGAVNFVLKDNFSGLEASARYGFASGMNEFNANVAAGHSSGRSSFSIIGTYQRRSELLGADRAISRDPDNPLATLGQGDICNPGTVYSLNGANLPGLSSPMAAIPPGVTGKPLVSDFNATAGKVNKCSVNSYADLLPPLEREGALASGEFKFSDAAAVFSELLVSHEAVQSRVGNLISFYGAYGSTLPSSNAFNPFGEDVGLSYTYPGLAFHYDRAATFVRPLVGLRGELGGGWAYEVTGFRSYDESHVTQNDNYNSPALQAALASSDPATALNPFAQGAPGSGELLASLFGPPLVLRFESWDTTIEGIVRGPIFRLKSGPVQTVFGAEFDRSKLYTYQQDVAITSAANVSRRDAYSLFTEARVPLMPGPDIPGDGDRLAIGLAGRHDHSNDYGGKSTGQVSVEWRPTGSLLFRGGYAMAYQAPQLTQLAGASGSFITGGYVDPFRGNQAVNNVEQDFGPNPNLKPETGASRQLGFVYSSGSIEGLKASLTRWDISITNYIGTPNPQDLINFPNLFPGAVTRAAPSAQDVQNGYLGPITAIHDVFYNFGDVRVSGVDVDVAYTMHPRIGRLTPSLSLTETDKFTSSISPALPPTSSVSQASLSVGFAPRWKGVTSLAWERGACSLRMDARYIGRYRDYQDFIPNTNELGNFVLFDANFRYGFGEALTRKNQWLSGAYIVLGAVNLFDKLPQKSFLLSNFDYAESDIRGRFVYAQLGGRF